MYSAADFVDDVFRLIPISDEEIEFEVERQCKDDDDWRDYAESDDVRFSAWAECALRKLRELTQQQ